MASDDGAPLMSPPCLNAARMPLLPEDALRGTGARRGTNSTAFTLIAELRLLDEAGAVLVITGGTVAEITGGITGREGAAVNEESASVELKAMLLE